MTCEILIRNVLPVCMLVLIACACTLGSACMHASSDCLCMYFGVCLYNVPLRSIIVQGRYVVVERPTHICIGRNKQIVFWHIIILSRVPGDSGERRVITTVCSTTRPTSFYEYLNFIKHSSISELWITIQVWPESEQTIANKVKRNRAIGCALRSSSCWPYSLLVERSSN